jgi:phosphonate transport system ATP-binding protein
VLGEHVSSLSGKALAKLRSRIAFVPQTQSTLPTLSVLYNVLMSKLGQVSFWQALRQQLAPSLQDRKQVYELLEQLGIEDKINTRAEDLSGGQQQRVAIARAVFSKPQIILADEPVASLDPGTAETIMHFLDAYRKDQGATVMMSMHQAGMALRCCSRIVALERGRLVYDGPPPGVDLKQLYGQHAKELLQEVEYGRS